LVHCSFQLFISR